MRVYVLDLDGSITAQESLLKRYQPVVSSLQALAPRVRLACRHGQFERFERAALGALPPETAAEASITLYGSGDFHHVSLGLMRRLSMPFNLLVLDNHPDWMRGVPLLHCGTWLYHAARLPQVQRVIHVGGDVDFDNYYQPLAPWRLLRSGKIVVIPGVRRYHRGRWRKVANEPLRSQPASPANRLRLRELLAPWRTDLARWPLYISLDKDVMTAEDAVVNWDSGQLRLTEVGIVLDEFLAAARGCLAGMDIVGDWSPVRLRGWLPRLSHLTMHPSLPVDAEEATQRNEQTNLAVLAAVERCLKADRAPLRTPA